MKNTVSDTNPSSETFQSLVSRLNVVHGEPRSCATIFHLFVESRLNWIIKLKHPKKKIENLRFSDKLKIVEKLQIIPNDLLYDVRIMNQIRNMFSHTIQIESIEFRTHVLCKLQLTYCYKSMNITPEMTPYNIFYLLALQLFNRMEGAYKSLKV